MLDEQQALEARLRQFVADASHELRTPVSVILGITELWRRGELRSGNQRDEAIHRIGVSGTQMGRLVEDLLLLARLDEGQPLEHEPVDLGSLVREVVADITTTTRLGRLFSSFLARSSYRVTKPVSAKLPSTSSAMPFGTRRRTLLSWSA